MKRVTARIASLLITLFASFILYNSRDGVIQGILWAPKLLASALSPVLACLSVVYTLLGLKRRDWLLVAAGGLGTAITLRHLQRVTASHDHEFARAFGTDWEVRLPESLRPHLRPYRWRPVYRRRRQGPLHQDVRYGTNSDSGRPLIADLMQPPPGVPHTGLAMIFVHGGGWWIGRKNITKFPYFERLCNQGHLVMDINYTLAPRSSVIGMAKDVKQAILWLKGHADSFNLNPERIVLTGQSAGAHLSLLAAYTPNHPTFQPAGMEGDSSVRAVISYQGPTDMVVLHDDIQERFVRYFPNHLVAKLHHLLEIVTGYRESPAGGIASIVGGTPTEIPDVYHLISPTTYASPDCPPTLLIQGTHDLLVDYRMVERFYQRLQECGVPVVYVPFPQCNHAFEAVLPRYSPPAQSAAYYTERFLALMV